MTPQPTHQARLDAELAAAIEIRKVAVVARTVAARQLADYTVYELPGVVVTPAETARQLALYRLAVDAEKAAHARYLAADKAWTLG